MKKREVIILLVSITAIGIATFFMLRLLFPPTAKPTEGESNLIPTVPNTVDETTYKNVENLSDYGTVTLDGLGKSDLFAGF